MTDKITITVTIDASLSSKWNRVVSEEGEETNEEDKWERVLETDEPCFRYSFLEDKKQIKEKTAPLGVEAGNGWAEVPVETEPEPEEEVELDSEGNPVENEEVIDPKPEATNLRFTKTHGLGFDEAGLIEFNEFPFLSLTMSDMIAGSAATATLPGQTTYNFELPPPTFDDEGAEIPAPEPDRASGRNFIFTDTFDLSAFFTDPDPIVVEYGNLTGEPNRSTEDGYPLTPPPPVGLRYLKVTISADKPLLSGAALTKYNPLKINLRNIRDMPGVRVTSLATQHYVEPTKFKLLEKYAFQPYCIVRVFNGDDPIFDRVTRSRSMAHRPKADIGFRTNYIIGHLDRQFCMEAVETRPVSVELQDREPKITEEEERKEVLKWEMMIAGGNGIDEDDEAYLPDAKEGVNVTKPVDVFAVDQLRMRSIHEGWKTAGDSCSHGISKVHTGLLLDQSAQLAAAFNVNNLGKNDNNKKRSSKIDLPQVRKPFIKERLDVLQEKRRRIPIGGLDEWQLNEGELLIRKTGNYLNDSAVPLQHADMHLNYRSESTSIGLKIELQAPLLSLQEGDAERTGEPDEIYRPFTRAVYTFEYGNVGLLQSLNKAIEGVNSKNLDMIGSLMTYELTEEEIERAEGGDLNIICGFTVLDDDCRMIFIEGTVEGMVLSNPEIRFKKRLYTSFNVDLKKVRLREPLPMLTSMPSIYNRAKVSEECFEALQRLGEIRHSNRMSEANVLQMFPNAAMVTSIESKYGESISMEDILGVKPKKKIRSWERVDEGPVVEEEVVEDKKKEIVRLKGPTDDKNPEFDAYLKTRTSKDFLAEQGELLKMAQAEADVLREERIAQDALEDPDRYMYSTQRLAYTEIKKAQMRDRLSKEKNCTFTYSQDYTSQTVSMVDAERLKHVLEDENKAKWKTKGGFCYPAPRKASEYAIHPDKPSQSRIDILSEEWTENEMHPENVKREIKLKPGQPDFNTVPSNGKMIFGGFEAPKYTRDYESRNIGSSVTLPRGKEINDMNPAFFNSVHLNGEAQAAEEEALRKKAEDEWRSKIVVDSLDFLVGGFVQKDVPDQLDRVSDILDGKALKKSLLIVRNARLPSGKKVPLRPPPYSIFSGEMYEDPKDFTEDLRPNDPTTYLTKNETTGVGEDFYRYIHHHTGKPKSQTFVAKVPIQPMTDAERFSGDPRWGG
ncbi:hypothetical protein TL16_g12744 [Triparma laevis f. inornata]|uniref:Uncharacterized protein n=1 Tax=Triparma laevis f. inornata TaxID=1714386 RepID=A0A9W7BTL5_9STRA|nr:hypothetical protein TL16_g12744 [Triparma laevis f. inornata]